MIDTEYLIDLMPLDGSPLLFGLDRFDALIISPARQPRFAERGQRFPDLGSRVRWAIRPLEASAVHGLESTVAFKADENRIDDVPALTEKVGQLRIIEAGEVQNKAPERPRTS